ncbi:MAG: hypothetical protein NT086_06635 [Proteobacteria bacterium]|nr:hypothetical protein [Pseudomonadota bacterium]
MNLNAGIHTLDDLPEDVQIPPELWDGERGSISWLLALDRLKQSTGIVEEKEFANYLNIPSSTLSDVRRGKMEINPRIKCQILNFLGFHSLTTVMQLLLNEERAAALKRTIQRQAKKIAASNAAKNGD